MLFAILNSGIWSQTRHALLLNHAQNLIEFSESCVLENIRSTLLALKFNFLV